MNKNTADMDREVKRLLADPDFAARTAARVEQKALHKSYVRPALAAAGIALVLSVTLFNRGSDSPPGLHTDASDLVAAQEIGETPWQDTDSVISAALASR